jgi:transposase
MSKMQKDPLRELIQQEDQALRKLAKSTSERMDVVKRANALLAVRAGTSYTEAAKVAGYKSNDTISRLVSRFNQRGLLALSIAAGRGRKPTYTSVQQTRILAEVQRTPDHTEDQTGTWLVFDSQYKKCGGARMFNMRQLIAILINASLLLGSPS